VGLIRFLFIIKEKIEMISVCATGDSIMMEAPPEDYAGFVPLSNLIKRADVKISNLEMVLSNYDCFASTFCGGTWLTAPPEMLDKLMEFGFNYFSIANNHTMDYSYDGLASTLKTLEKAKVAYSGAGMDLEQASRPAILRTNNGSVGIISICATNDDAARAGDPQGPIPGRPGLNPLRHSEIYFVNAGQMNTLKEIARSTCINGRIDNSKKGGYTPEKPGLFSLGPIDFKESQEEGKISIPNKFDMKRTKREIEEVLKQADYAIVIVHSHEIKRLTDDEPDYFLEEFSRRCIDWGACAVIGSGTHQLKAVEIYKNRPIFYSIGNFIFQSDASLYLPADYYERYNIPQNYSAAKAIAVRSENGTRGLECDFRNFRAIIPYIEFKDGELYECLLIPIELGFDMPRKLKGYPIPANEEVAYEVMNRLANLSRPYGTSFEMKNRCISVGLRR